MDRSEKELRSTWGAARSALPRTAIMLFSGWFIVWVTSKYAEVIGQYIPASEYIVPMFNGIGLIIAVMGVAKFLLNLFNPYADGASLMNQVFRDKSVAAAISYLGNCILGAVIIMVLASSLGFNNVKAQGLSANAQKYLPLFVAEQKTYWPTLTVPSYMAGQIEQESLWDPKAQLKNHREQGVGFGQQTRAWDSLGNLRFDALTAIVNKYPKDLNGYTWATWDQRPDLSMRATVLMTKDLCGRIKNTATEQDMFRMCLAAYNGGEGGLGKDRLACRAKPGCNPSIWFGHVELTSTKSRVPMAIYGGRSIFDINRGYITNIEKRRQKYIPFTDFA